MVFYNGLYVFLCTCIIVLALTLPRDRTTRGVVSLSARSFVVTRRCAINNKHNRFLARVNYVQLDSNFQEYFSHSAEAFQGLEC